MSLPELTAADAGMELACYMGQHRGKPMDPDHLRGLIALMMELPAESPADALACSSWLSWFLPSVLAHLQNGDDDNAQELLQTACRMAERVTVALEVTTGRPRETYIGAPPSQS